VKIVAVDNFDRGTYDDMLVCDNILHKIHAEVMCKMLNDYWNRWALGCESRYFYKIVEDDYVLRTYEH